MVKKTLENSGQLFPPSGLSESGCSSVFTLHNICLLETNILDIIAPYDLLVDATDNFPAHYMINDAAIISGKPFVYGSVNHNAGFVSAFNLPGGPSFRCLYPQRPRNQNAERRRNSCIEPVVQNYRDHLWQVKR